MAATTGVKTIHNCGRHGSLIVKPNPTSAKADITYQPFSITRIGLPRQGNQPSAIPTANIAKNATAIHPDQ